MSNREDIFIEKPNLKLEYTLALAAALITFFVFLPALSNGFVNWDDNYYVYENLNIRHFDLDFFKWAFTTTSLSNYHPLTLISHGIDHAIWGLDPKGYHLTNIILHSLNVLLVFFITSRAVSIGLGGAKNEETKETNKKTVLLAALLAALLFGTHPLRIESVVWISERTDVLCAFFYLFSILVYLGYGSAMPRRPLLYIASFLLFLAALLSKPMAVTLPAVLLIIDFFPLKRFNRKEIKAVVLEKIPFFALSLAASVVTIIAQKDAMASLESITLATRISTALRGFAFYIYKTIIPLKLSPLYPLPKDTSLFGIEYIASAIALLAITIFVIVMLRRTRLYLAAFAYYIVTVLPVIGLLQAGSQATADRFTYLPTIPFFMLAGLGVAYIFFSKSSTNQSRAVIILPLAFIIFTSILTVKQTAIWKDSITLWSAQIERFPGASSTAYFNRGTVYMKRGNCALAIDDYKIAIDIKYNHIEAHNNLGICYKTMKIYGEAVKSFSIVIDNSPREDVYVNRAATYIDLGEFDRAARDLRAAIKINPKSVHAYHNLAMIFEATGDRKKAIENLRKASALGFAPATDLLKGLGLN